MNNDAQAQNRILWLQVIGLGAVQGVISLTWLIYRLYLPKLLTSFGFSEQLAITVLIIENILGLITEPLFGELSDRMALKHFTRFPMIILGVILSSAFFIALPTIVIFGNSEGVIRWILPLMSIAWALAMTTFRSPVMALLGMSAPMDKLPIAASILVIVSGIITAFSPILKEFFLSLGAGITFSLGSISLLAGVALLRYFTKPTLQPTSENQESRSPLNSATIRQFALIVATGITLSWAFRLLMSSMTNGLNKYQMVIVFIFIALASFPNGIIAEKIGNQKAMLLGIGASLLSLLLLNFSSQIIITVIAIELIIITVNLVMNGTIPFALSLSPPQRSGLGIGLYFGGFGLGSSLFDIIFSAPGNISPITKASVGALAFLLAGGCIAFSQKRIIN